MSPDSFHTFEKMSPIYSSLNNQLFSSKKKKSSMNKATNLLHKCLRIFTQENQMLAESLLFVK